MFDPAQPATNSALSSAVMRSQLTSLKALIDAILTLTAAQVDDVTTLNPGDPATVAVSVTGSTLHFTFGIPRGDTGAQGQQGPPGEVSQVQLDAAIAGTAVNPGAVSPLGQSAFSYYDQTQMQNVLDKVDELLNALKRIT
ncbi:MAG: hypothetical protein HS117_12290 [Verrucomicrobiaceae bacterium]|jgi:ethanolamine utilization microcompartment shell protein EutL|nr:hypothetical protein [Verrucomicrobiaceae bacterium]